MRWDQFIEAETRRRADQHDYRSQTMYLLSRLHRVLRDGLVTEFASHGVGFAEYALLNILRASEPITNADLARLTSVSPQATSRLVAKLTMAGYIARIDAPGGLQPLVLTETGRALHATLSRIEQEHIDRLRGDDQLVETLNIALERAIGRYEGYEPR